MALTAAEFGLGTPLSVEPTPGGGAKVHRLTTDTGAFIVKPARRRWEVELYHVVAQALNARGVRQATLRVTPYGELVGRSGHYVQECLPGRIADRPPSDAAADAVMRYLGAYDAALADVPVPDALLETRTVWTKVTSPAYLRMRLPDLFQQYAPPGLAAGPVREALAYVGRWEETLRQLPVQLVHADHGPGNFLYDGDSVVAAIDFTPGVHPRLFSVATTCYWHDVYGRAGHPARDRIRLDIEAYTASHAWTGLEYACFPAMLVREALRRLATPLAARNDLGTPVRFTRFARRHQAVVDVLSCLPSG